MTDDFLSRLAAAQTTEERAWIATEDLLNGLPSDLSSAAWAAAIPHWFDADILGALRPELKESAQQLYASLQPLPFVEVFSGRGCNIHELTRKVMLDHLWRNDSEEFRAISARAAEYFSGDDKPERKIEWLYHLVVADAANGADEFRKLDEEWSNTFRYSELAALANVLLEHAESNRITGRARAAIYLSKGEAEQRAYRTSEALEALNKARQETEDDQGLLAYTLIAIGDVLRFLDQNEEALARYNEALPLFRVLGNRVGEASTLKAIGDALWFLDQNNEALAHYTDALESYRAAGSRLGQANALASIGNVLQFRRQNEEALARYNEALILCRAVGARQSEATTLASIGIVLVSLNKNEEALARFDEALTLFRAVGGHLGEANTLKAIGNVFRFIEQNEEASARYGEALKLFRAVGDRLGEAHTLKDIGDLLNVIGENEEGVARYDEALKLYRAAGSRHGEANTLHSFGDERRSQQDFIKALEFYQSAMTIYEQIGDRYSQSRNLLQTARVQRALEQRANAVDSLVRATRLADEVDVESLRRSALEELAEVSKDQGNWTALVNLLDSLLAAHPDDADLRRTREEAQTTKQAEDLTAEE